MKVKVKVAQSCLTLCNPMGLYSPWNSLGQNTGVGSPSLFQGIFPTQGLNPGLPHCQVDSLPDEPQGKPKNTGVGSWFLLQLSSPPRNQTRVSCTAGGFFTKELTGKPSYQVYSNKIFLNNLPILETREIRGSN